MASIFFVGVRREIRCLLQETLEKHGYQVQYDEGASAMKLFSAANISMYMLLALDNGTSSAVHASPAPARQTGRPSFLTALLRAFSTWST